MEWRKHKPEVKNNNLIAGTERNKMGGGGVRESHGMTLTRFSRDQSLRILSVFLLSGRQIQG